VRESFSHAENCDLFLVIGSSLVVFPAAQLPINAVHHSAKLIIIGLSDTPYDKLAHVMIRAGAGQAMTRLLQEMGILFG
jgi:NAD-dependent deacetylase